MADKTVRSKIKPLRVEQLRLDPENPRLPDGMDGAVSRKVVQYYLDNYVLDELIDSYIESGYFEQEPMVVKRDDGDDTYIVLEGNRRLAALIQLLRLPGHVKSAKRMDVPKKALDRLKTIPCLVVKSRTEIASFLGFRHIGGLKPWPPEAKARFVASELTRHIEEGEGGNPFSHVARMIGTNAQSVRQTYFAFRLLRYARDEHRSDTAYVENHRFGVWLRCMSSQGIMERLNATIPKNWEEFDTAINAVAVEPLRELISDLTPGDGPAVLSDSRDVTAYGHVVSDRGALRILRRTKDLAAASQLIQGTLLAPKIEAVARRVDALLAAAEDLEDYDPIAYEAAKHLSSRARTLLKVLEDAE